MEILAMEATRSFVFGITCTGTILLSLALIVICTWCSRSAPAGPDSGGLN